MKRCIDLVFRVLPPLAAALTGASALSGCTVVHIATAEGARVSYYPGLAVIRISAARSMQVVEEKSLGVAAGARQMTLGWSDRRVALVPPGRCQLLLWRPSRSAVADLAARNPRPDLCSLKGDGE